MRRRINKKNAAILLLISTILFLVIQYHYKSFDSVLGANGINVTKVDMRNGNTGGYVSTTDKDKIKELVNLVDNRYYRKSFMHLNQMSGFTFYYDFYVGDKQILRISGDGNNVQLNNTHYHVSKSISNKLLTNWFNSLPIT